MVFQKKGGVKARQQQSLGKPKNKKQVEDEEDFDMLDMDSDEDEGDSDEETVLKTPANKSFKGKQVQSDKKVSFQIPGKNTPAKTPKAINQVKKPPTPGKGSLQEFKGMKGKNELTKNGKAKQVESDDDDEDDDEEDDDIDFDEDADLDMMLGDDDDEEDDDDDDDDDEDEEEEDDDEEDETPKKKQNIKSDQSKSAEKAREMKNEASAKTGKTPVKSEKTPSKNLKTPQKDKTPLKSEKTPSQSVSTSDAALKTPLKVESPQKFKKQESDTPGMKKLMEMDAQSRRERDIKTLYLGNLPNGISREEVKALSSDIITVHFPKTAKNRKFVFAFLEFASEEKAEENFKILEKKKLRNQPLKVDFTGDKSRTKPKESEVAPSDKSFNFKKLYLSSLPDSATIVDLANLFPKSIQISLNGRKDYRTATVLYLTEQDAAEELEVAKKSQICGSYFTVKFSYLGDKKKKRQKKQHPSQPPAKKMKVEKIEPESEDESDEDESD